MAISVVSAGVAAAKASVGITVTVASAAVGDWCVICYCGDQAGTAGNFSGAGAGGGNLSLTRIIQANNTVTFTEIWYGQVLTAITSKQAGVNGTSSQSSAIAVYIISGLSSTPLDKSNSGVGASTTPSSGASGTTTQADEVAIGAIGTEGPDGDLAGTWGTDINTNVQRLGTTGGSAASNETIASAAAIKSATGSFTASKTGITSRNWGACVATLMGASAVEPYPAGYEKNALPTQLRM